MTHRRSSRAAPGAHSRPGQSYAQEHAPRKSIAGVNPAVGWAAVLTVRLARYGADIGAVLFLALAALTLIGLLRLSSGALLTAWAAFLLRWLGWGALIVPASLGWLGWVQIAGRMRGTGGLHQVHWWRVIAMETSAVALLGLLNLAGGSNVARAALGLGGGGLVGWGIGYIFAQVLPPPADGLALLAVFIFGLFFGTDVTADRLGRLVAWLEAQGREKPHGETPGAAGAVGSARRQAGRAVTTPTAGAAASSAVTSRDTAPQRRARVKLGADERVRVPVQRVDTVVKSKARRRAAHLPGLELLDDSDLRKPAQKEIDETGSIIVKTLKEFGVPVTVVGARVGPSVTQFQVEPGFVEKPGPDGMSKQWKVRVAQISSLADDMALALSASSLRIEAPVPGRSYVGIEVPHRRTSLVSLRPVLEADSFQKINSPLAIALGRDVSGTPISADLGKMPHLLIAGTTGSGKSVLIASLVTCLISNNTPDDLRLVLIDPKMVELVRFNGLPHLFGKVETDLDRITGVLRWVTREMDRRYRLFESVSARNLENYITKTAKKATAERLPRIVVMIDELADLMMRAPDETERTLVRLAQMARATGIHLVVATQRPSTDIVTGLIKANFPARISFAVTSAIDSRVILDSVGAESLLGRGDMLYQSPEAASAVRLQGCFVSDREIDRIVSFWRDQAAEAAAAEAAEAGAGATAEAEPVAAGPRTPPGARPRAAPAEAESPQEIPAGQAPWEIMLAREKVVEDKDHQIEQAIAIVKKYGTASASLLQRKMRIGYPRAARLMDELRSMGIIGREQAGGKTREVFVRGEDDPIGDEAARLVEGDEDEAGDEEE